MQARMYELHVETTLGVASQEYCLIFETGSLICLGLPFKLGSLDTDSRDLPAVASQCWDYKHIQ